MTMPIREPERSVTGAPLSPGRRWARMIRTRYPGDMTPRPTKVPCVNTAALGFVAMTPNPTVMTFSPACRSSRYREAAYPRVRPLTDSRARSSRALAATRLASWSPPSSVHTDRPGHPVTTWRLVTRKPAGETKKPVPLFTRPAAEPSPATSFAGFPAAEPATTIMPAARILAIPRAGPPQGSAAPNSIRPLAGLAGAADPRLPVAGECEFLISVAGLLGDRIRVILQGHNPVPLVIRRGDIVDRLIRRRLWRRRLVLRHCPLLGGARRRRLPRGQFHGLLQRDLAAAFVELSPSRRADGAADGGADEAPQAAAAQCRPRPRPDQGAGGRVIVHAILRHRPRRSLHGLLAAGTAAEEGGKHDDCKGWDKPLRLHVPTPSLKHDRPRRYGCFRRGARRSAASRYSLGASRAGRAMPSRSASRARSRPSE